MIVKQHSLSTAAPDNLSDAAIANNNHGLNDMAANTVPHPKFCNFSLFYSNVCCDTK